MLNRDHLIYLWETFWLCLRVLERWDPRKAISIMVLSKGIRKTRAQKNVCHSARWRKCLAITRYFISQIDILGKNEMVILNLIVDSVPDHWLTYCGKLVLIRHYSICPEPWHSLVDNHPIFLPPYWDSSAIQSNKLALLHYVFKSIVIFLAS